MPAALKHLPDTVEKSYVRHTQGEASEPNFEELSVVALTAGVRSSENVYFPAGTEGTIVAVWGDGAEYEVEFEEPVGSLATVRREHLRLV
jgi:hypothetical protein